MKLAKGRGSQAAKASEGAREVTLVGEACVQGDVHQGSVRCDEPLAGMLDPKLTDVFAHRTAKVGAKRAGQVDRVDADFAGKFAQSGRSGEAAA
jgi:hypothetical protein